MVHACGHGEQLVFKRIHPHRIASLAPAEAESSRIYRATIKRFVCVLCVRKKAKRCEPGQLWKGCGDGGGALFYERRPRREIPSKLRARASFIPISLHSITFWVRSFVVSCTSTIFVVAVARFLLDSSCVVLGVCYYCYGFSFSLSLSLFLSPCRMSVRCSG